MTEHFALIKMVYLFWHRQRFKSIDVIVCFIPPKLNSIYILKLYSTLRSATQVIVLARCWIRSTYLYRYKFIFDLDRIIWNMHIKKYASLRYGKSIRACSHVVYECFTLFVFCVYAGRLLGLHVDDVCLASA